MKIEKKIWPEFFQEVLNGNKNFEIRLDNFECKPGDILFLREYDPKNETYTGRYLEKEVTYVFKTKNLKFWSKENIEKYGLQVISLKCP